MERSVAKEPMRYGTAKVAERNVTIEGMTALAKGWRCGVSTGRNDQNEHGKSQHGHDCKKCDSPISPQRPAGEPNNKWRLPPVLHIYEFTNTFGGFQGAGVATRED